MQLVSQIPIQETHATSTANCSIFTSAMSDWINAQKESEIKTRNNLFISHKWTSFELLMAVDPYFAELNWVWRCSTDGNAQKDRMT